MSIKCLNPYSRPKFNSITNVQITNPFKKIIQYPISNIHLKKIHLFNSIQVTLLNFFSNPVLTKKKLHIRSVPLGEYARRIRHQEQTRTFAICSLKYNSAGAEESEMHFVRLLDDLNFDFISVYSLDTYEYGCFIMSYSFSDDNNVYYCIGTAYVLPEENEPTKGRILVFSVEEGKLQLIAEKETKGVVYCLNAFNGKLLAAINQKIQLYKWVLREDGTHELQSECEHRGHILALYVQIVVGDLVKSISLLMYKKVLLRRECVNIMQIRCQLLKSLMMASYLMWL